MHKVKAKGILSSKNGMNIYRGCQHGCIYCDARSKCYQMDHLFEDVEVKENAPELLEEALFRKRKKCMVGTGAMSDPYTPLEMELGLTRQCLEIIERYGHGVTILTKSDRILRDLDLLKRINEKTKCVVQMTLTCMDDDLSRIIEPGVCPTSRRIEVLNIMKEEGIPTVVWMLPILPYITDTEENIRGLTRACVEADVKGILTFGSFGLTLREGDREYYYSKLDQHFPGLKQRYMREYGDAYELPSKNESKLFDVFRQELSGTDIMINLNQIFDYMNEFEDKQAGEQLSLFDL